MFGLKKLNARLEEAEARITGLVKLREIDEQERADQHATSKRLAGAIDELEARINNNQITVNAAFGGLSRRVGGVSQDVIDGLASIDQALASLKQIAAVPSAAPSPPALPQAAIAGGDDPTPAPLTSTEDIDRLVLGGAFDLPDEPRKLFVGSAALKPTRPTVREDGALDRARADR